jgi:hypothetical protein
MISKFRQFLALCVGVAAGLAATSALADPPRPSHHHWINTNYASHYVLYDYASRQWIETINCQVAYRFNLVSHENNAIILNDPSRDMTIRLDYDGMYLKPHGATEFSFYQAGTFDRREQFQHFDANGAYTGAITKLHACEFVEYLAGATSPTFRFHLANNANGAVELYDGSRDLWVKLDQSRMYLHFGANPYAFFKDGHW